MRKLTIAVVAALAMLVAGLISWNSQAAPISAAIVPAVPASSMVEKAACGGPGPYCPPGRHHVCGPRGCWCAPCGGYYYHPYYHRRYYRY